jgi:hypothetical protein
MLREIRHQDSAQEVQGDLVLEVELVVPGVVGIPLTLLRLDEDEGEEE